MSQQYTIKLTKNQLEVIQTATDLLTRIQLGQWDEIIQHLPIRKDVDHKSLYSDKRVIASILSQHLKDGMDGIFASFGVGNPELPESNSIALDIHHSIRHKLSWEQAVKDGIVATEDSKRQWPEMMTVNYDPPMKWSKEPLPVIERCMES